MTISNTSESAEIEAIIFEYFQALNHGDVDAVLTLYTDDPVQLPFLLPSIVGTDAIRKNYEITFQQIRFRMRTTIKELVQMSPEWAYVRTDTAGMFTPVKTGKKLRPPSMNSFYCRRAATERGISHDIAFPRLQNCQTFNSPEFSHRRTVERRQFCAFEHRPAVMS